jgi:putative transposase
LFLLTRNAVIVDREKNYYRVLRVSPKDNLVAVIALGRSDAFAELWYLNELQLDANEGRFTLADVTGMALVPGTLSKKSEALKTWRWSIIEDLVIRADIFSRKGRKHLLVTHAKKLRTTESTLRLCLRLYWQGGQTEDALAPNFELCGIERDPDSVSEEQKRSRKVRGRDREDGRDKFYMSDALKREVIQLATIALHSKTVTRKHLYRHLCDALWSSVGADGKTRVLSPESERPTRRQVTYLIDNSRTLEDNLRRLGSPKSFENNHAPKLGNVLQECLGVGHQYEIDSTIVDLWLVARDNRSKIVGKPTLYLISDRFSRLIVGFHLSLDKPSWATAKEAILSLVEDKGLLCARWRAKYEPRDWVAHGLLPSMFVADRGSEYIGFDSDRIANDVECGLVNVPAYFSSRKGVIECQFKLVQVPLKDDVAGYQPPLEATKRHGDGYEHDAEYTLDELFAEFVDIISMQNRKMHPGMPMDQEMTLGGIPPVPIEVWNYDKTHRAGLMSTFSEEYLRIKLLHRKRGVVTKNGIRLNGLFYTCKHAEDEQWFVRGGVKRFPVQVSYDRRRTNHIYIYDLKNPRRYYQAELTPASRVYADQSHAEAAASIALRKKYKRQAEEHNMQLEYELEQKRAERASKAHELTQQAIAAANGASRTSGTKELREAEAKARAKEVVSHREQAVGSPTPPPSPKPAAPVSAPVAPSTYAIPNPLDALLGSDDD